MTTNTFDTFICIHRRDVDYLLKTVLDSYRANFVAKGNLFLVTNDLPYLQDFIARRAPDIEGALPLSFYAIGAGAGLVIAAMLATRTVTADIAVLVPVGSMIIANAMNACAQSMERFRADIRAHVGQIEAALALGAAPAVTVLPFVQSAPTASSRTRSSDARSSARRVVANAIGATPSRRCRFASVVSVCPGPTSRSSVPGVSRIFCRPSEKRTTCRRCCAQYDGVVGAAGVIHVPVTFETYGISGR